MTEEILIENKEVYLFGPFRVEAAERLLFKNNAPVRLPAKAFDLLLVLVESGGHLKSRKELIETLWPNTIVEEANLTWNVNALRQALGDNRRAPRYVETVRGHGYRFIAPVTTPAGDPPEEADPEPEPEGGRRRRRVTIPVLAGCVVALIAALALTWYFALYRPGATGAARPVVAVLPFQDLSADGDSAWFAAGIRDTILSKLAEIGELRVISRTSTERYPSHPVNLRRIAIQLGATAILEGSVQKAGNRVLINTQLIDAKTDEHLWAHIYTRSLADVFAAETDVATQVATALQARLLPAETELLAKTPTHDPQAYLLFLKANYHANRVIDNNNVENLTEATTRAVSLYRQAIARDPDFALAWARLSYLKSYAYLRTIAHTADDMTEAEHAAKRALALAPDLPQAQLAMGYVYYYGHHDLAAALTQFERARQSLPNDANVIGAIALIHRRQGKWEKTLSEFQRAAQLDTRNTRWPYETGFTLMLLRRYAQATLRFDQALALAPKNYGAATLKVMSLMLAGKPSQEVREMLAKIPPAGGSQKGLVLTLRFQTELFARRAAEALAAIAKAPEWLQASTAVGREPTDLLRAPALALEKKDDQAQKAYANARDSLQKALREHPQNASLWSFLGLAEAGLGKKREAIEAGRKAVRLTPVSKDAIYGPSYLVNLAKIYVRTGESREAIELLRRLLVIPAGIYISAPLLERDPAWDPIRKNPAFQKLIKEYANKPPPLTS